MKTFLDLSYAQHDEVEDGALSLDVYAPEEATDISRLPVMIYVHGGSWIRGDKGRVHDKPNMFCDNGFVFVSINHRLIPEDVSPKNGTQRILDGVEDHTVQGGDVARASAWVMDNIERYGGDQDMVFLMGHSAGAHLVALVGTDHRFTEGLGRDLRALSGVVPVDTAVYDIPTKQSGNPTETHTRAFGYVESVWADASPTLHTSKGKGIPPFLVIYASKNPERERQSVEFVEKLRGADVQAELHFESKTHSAINQELGLEGDGPTKVILEFLDRVINQKEKIIT